jgi:hypothetical protein
MEAFQRQHNANRHALPKEATFLRLMGMGYYCPMVDLKVNGSQFQEFHGVSLA